MSKAMVSTFFVKGSNARMSTIFGTLKVPMGTRGKAIAAAMDVKGVMDTWWTDGELIIDVIDAEAVQFEVREKGVVVKTTNEILAAQLKVFAAASRFVVDNNIVVEKPKQTVKPDIEPIDAFSVAFRFTSEGTWGQRGLTATIDEATKPCLQELATLGVLSVNGVNRGHSCQGCETRVGHDADGKFVISSNHPFVARILAKYAKVIREMPAVFEFHRRFFPPSQAEIKAQMEAAFAEQAVRAANLAAFAQQQAAKAAEVVETTVKPARKSRATAQVAEMAHA